MWRSGYWTHAVRWILSVRAELFMRLESCESDRRISLAWPIFVEEYNLRLLSKEGGIVAER